MLVAAALAAGILALPAPATAQAYNLTGTNANGQTPGNAATDTHGDLSSTSVQIGGGKGGGFTNGNQITGGTGGSATLSVTNSMTASQDITLTGGNGGDLDQSGGGNDRTGGTGGDAALTVGGSLTGGGNLTLTGGNSGSGSGNGGNNNTTGDGGGATLNAGTVEIDGTLTMQSGQGISSVQWYTSGNAGAVALTANSLSASIINLIKQDGDLTVNVNTLDVSTASTSLNLDGTTASDVNVGRVFLSGGNTFTINSNNGGTFSLGGITVSGNNNHIGAAGSHSAIVVKSLSFVMDDANTTDPMLVANDKLVTDNSTTTSLTAGKALTQFTAGDKVTLVSGLDNASAYTAQTGVAATYGATDYLFDVGLDAQALMATFTGEKTVNNEVARGYAYGISARSVALNNAYDNTLNIVHNWQMAAPGSLSSGSVRFNSFAQLSASHTKTKTGSHVDNDGITFAGGAGWELPVSDGSLLLGLFVEGGTGSYDSYNSYARSDGDTWHYGAGGFAKYRMNRGTYFEGSVRTGRTKSDLDGKGIDDYGYDSTSWYWGAHAGIGQEWAVSQSGMVDTYLKAIWTRTDSDTVTTKAKEKLHFDSVDSIRSRLGARYVHTTDAGFKAYAGAGWEYEFDGEVKSSLHGQKIHGTNELQGHSGLIEAGLEWNATKAWTMNAKVEGLIGRREGVSGMFMANYRF